MDTSTKAAFYHYPELESVRLLMDLMTDPGRYNHHLESYIARVTCRLAWGTAAPSDELKQRARELLYGVSPSGSLGNKLAFLMKLPQKWSSVKAWEVRRARTERRFFERMQDSVRSQISRPETLEAPQSWMRQCLEKNASWGFASDLEGAYAVGMHGIAGALTVAAPMQSFCLAICHFPQYQPILHEEIDRVCGDRMPTFSDMESMPILRAFIRETMRWRPPVPTGMLVSFSWRLIESTLTVAGIPHELIQDDVYEGYHIPAGSIIHPLEWSLGRDPAVFYNPEAFNPLRWLDSSFPTYREPLTKYPTITSYSQFGYGRRTCQGMAVTEADLFVGLGSLAWLFSVSKPGASAEPSTPQEETVAMSIKEQDLSLAHNMPFGLSTPPDENEIAFHFSSDALNRKLSHVDNNKTFVPKSFTAPATPPDSPPRRLSLDTSTATKMKSATKTEPISSRAKSKQEPDPTLEYTSLLIAKPLPFALELKIRNQDRADLVAREWMARKMEGEFEDAECYWEGGNDGNDMFGWSKIPGS